MKTFDRSGELVGLPFQVLVPPPKSARRAASSLALVLAVFLVACIAAPFRQSAAGEGRVIAFTPIDRRQNVEAPVGGRVVDVFVQEGEHVEAGDPLVAIQDNDPRLLERYAAERDALEQRLASYRLRAETLETRIVSVEEAQRGAVAAARARVEGAEQRAQAARATLEAARAALETAVLQAERQRDLVGDGLVSAREVELAELALARARTDERSAEASVRGADAELSSARAALAQLDSDSRARVQEAEASRSSAEVDVAGAIAALQRLEVTIARQAQQLVRAPRGGTVLSVLARGAGEQVAAGDPLLVLVPDGDRMAVELTIDGNDAPLVTPGRAVRIQFEGFPAVQFAGWPAVAYGTFEGRVAFVDAHDDGRGDFRIVVMPREGAPAWPGRRYLRQGVRAKGWVLLDQVRLGYELWRRLNGFPPSVRPPSDAGAGSPSSSGKRGGGYGGGGSAYEGGSP